MAAISKALRLSKKLTGAEPSISTLCLGFVWRRFQKKYCRMQHAIVSAMLKVIQKHGGNFKVIRVSQKLRGAKPSISNILFRFVSYVSVLGLNHVDVDGGHFTNNSLFHE